MNNGEKKGGAVVTLKTIHASPELADLWQLHFSAEGGKEHNTGENMVANMTADPSTRSCDSRLPTPNGDGDDIAERSHIRLL